jgi:hypothetical protein
MSQGTTGYFLVVALGLQPLALSRGQELRRLPPVEPIPSLDGDIDGMRHRIAQLEASLFRLHNGTPPPLDGPVGSTDLQQPAAAWLQPVNRARFEQALWNGDFSIDIGGYFKADLIQDLNAIGSTDRFDPITIPTDGRPGENTRLHARQTRLNVDFHPDQDYDDLQVFVEGDFFGDGNTVRLRHAYLRVGRLLAGQTWTTFMDESILPATLDFESPRSIVLDRRALLRWTQPVADHLSVAVALEDPHPILDLSVAPAGGDVERPAPDLVSRFRYETALWHLQGAGLVRMIGYRAASGASDEEAGWGFNFTGRFRVRETDSVLFQVALGEGFESYRQAMDGAVDANGMVELNPVLAWVVGYEVDWTDRLSSTFVYSVAEGTTASFQPLSTAEAVEYLAANLVVKPLPRLSYGIEYLYGSRTDKDLARGEAHRLQFSVRYDLP